MRFESVVDHLDSEGVERDVDALRDRRQVGKRRDHQSTLEPSTDLPDTKADRLDEYFNNYWLGMVPNAGHLLHYENPDRANEKIKSFFDDLA